MNKVLGVKGAAIGTAVSAGLRAFTDKGGGIERAAGGGKEILDQAGAIIGTADPAAVSTFNNNNPAGGFSEYDQYLAPYQDIYTTKGTGWRYKVPYLEDQQRANTGAFQNASSLFGGMVNKIRDISTAISAFHSPGQYIDAAKSYMLGGGEKSYSVSFPLLNTGLPEDILRNWQFLFMLAYQNRPNRIDRLSIAPPKIYEAMIPGVWWCRHAYISSMTVNFTGNRRKMTLMLPVETGSTSQPFPGTKSASDSSSEDQPLYKQGDGSIVTYENITDPAAELWNAGGTGDRYAQENYNAVGNMPVTTIIPDAYEVTITLTELIPESQNTMFAAIQKPNTVTVTSGEGVKEEQDGRPITGSANLTDRFFPSP